MFSELILCVYVYALPLDLGRPCVTKQMYMYVKEGWFLIDARLVCFPLQFAERLW